MPTYFFLVRSSDTRSMGGPRCFFFKLLCSASLRNPIARRIWEQTSVPRYHLFIGGLSNKKCTRAVRGLEGYLLLQRAVRLTKPQTAFTCPRKNVHSHDKGLGIFLECSLKYMFTYIYILT